jgi:Fe-S-cluster containining protein
MKPCNQCGKCCKKYSDGGLSASTEEIKMWELFRPDIAEYTENGEIWVNPENAMPLKNCPWLAKQPQEEKYSCDIYFDRPNDCKYYPVTIKQMIEDDCEMLEECDLKNLEKAQKNLDKLMIDSRPAYI